MSDSRKQVGLMVEALNGYGTRILKGIARWVQLNPGWRLAFFDGERGELADLIRNWQGDGIICTVTDEEFAKAAKARKIPVVNVAGRHRKHTIPSVLGEDQAGGQLAAKYFLERGFQNFVYIGSLDYQFAKDRLRGFEEHLEDAGHSVMKLDSQLGNEEELAQTLCELPKPLAILTGTDRRAASVMEAAWQAELQVPDDVAILGMGDHTILCDLCTPTLSSVDLDMETRGFQAASLLFRLMSGDPAPSEPIRVPPVGVISRGSTDTYAFSDPTFAAARRFIQENAHEPIKVTDVASAVETSRRTLENRFKEFSSRSLHEEIWRAHFDRAKLLLTTTDLNLDEVASKSGFRTASSLANYFKLKTGLTPRTYRSEHRR